MTKQLTTAKVSTLRNWGKNPRFIKDNRYDELVDSIKELGFNDVLKVAADKTTVIGGNMRLKALQELGIDKVDILITTAKTDEEIFKIALRDNESFGEYDREQLVELAYKLEIPEVELDTYQIHLSKPESLKDIVLEDTAPEVEEDEAPEVDEKEEPKSKLGEIYQLGRHRVMCGDSVDDDDVNKLMNGLLADAVFTDPPWNVNYGAVKAGNAQGYKVNRTIENDNMGEDFTPWMNDVFGAMSNYSKDGCMTYVVMSPQEWGGLMNTLKDNGYHWSSTIIWNKDHLVLSRKDYHTKYEPIWYGWKEGESRLRPLKDRKQSDVWDINRPTRSDEHPTMKPIELCAKAINNSSDKDDVVLDLFLGSGSTLIACEQTDRICYGMELDPKYVDVIRKRWAKYVYPDRWEEEWQSLTPSL